MDLALYAVEAVLKEKRPRREVALTIGRSKSWVAKMVAAYQRDGEAGLLPAKRGPKVGPGRTASEVEDAVVRMRKELSDDGLDSGASTIRYHLLAQTGSSPARATIHRILAARGFVQPQPQKRPRSSWQRFEADLANETWQADVCHWRLADEEIVDIVTFIDDYSRMIVGTKVVRNCTSTDVLTTLIKAAASWGYHSALPLP